MENELLEINKAVHYFNNIILCKNIAVFTYNKNSTFLIMNKSQKVYQRKIDLSKFKATFKHIEVKGSRQQTFC